MANVFSKMYLVPEDSMKKFREENHLNSLLDTEMNKIIKMKIADTKKWYLYRQTLMKAANSLRGKPVKAAGVSTQTDIFPWDAYDSALINDYSIFPTPQPFRKRSTTNQGRPSLEITPEQFRKRSATNVERPSVSFVDMFKTSKTDNSNGEFNESLQNDQDREYGEGEQNEQDEMNESHKSQTDQENEKSDEKIITPPQNTSGEPILTEDDSIYQTPGQEEGREKSKASKKLFNPKKESTPQTTILTHFKKKIKNIMGPENSEITEIPPFKKKKTDQQGEGKIRFCKWINFE